MIHIETNIKINLIQELSQQNTDESLEAIFKYLKDEEDIAVKLTAIEALSEFNNFPKAKSMLIQLSKNNDEEVRYYSLEALRYFSGDDVGEAALYVLKDPDSLVRITATETLRDLNYNKAIPNLCEALMDANELVRGYAAEALGLMGGKELISILEERLKSEKRNAARLRFYIGLYQLGEKHYFDLILSMLKNRSYRIRCAAANSLVSIANEDNMQFVIASLKKALLKEKTIAAKSSIEGALEELLDKNVRDKETNK